MNLKQHRHILLTQAIEESDREGVLLPVDDREAATSAECKTLADGESRFLAARSARLIEKLSQQHSEIRSAASPLIGPAVITIAILILALFLGFYSNKLGPEQRINILAFPLLGMLAWNFLMYLLEIVRGFVKAPSFGFAKWLNQVQDRFGGKSEPVGPLKTSLTLFSSNWGKAAGPARVSKLRATLHLAAGAFALAMIAGMYVQGLAYEYRAIWQSTFFDSDSVQSLVDTVLGPAAAVRGEAVPNVAEMQWTLKNQSAGDDAANWIHLYAITIGLFIVLPRGGLCLFWWFRSRIQTGAIDLREFSPAYFDRLLAEARGDSIAVRLVPHSHSVAEEMRKPIKNELAGLLGGPVNVEWADGIAFGEESEFLAGLRDLPRSLILLFNFSATPEEEIHGDLVRELRAKLDGTETNLRIVLDASKFDEKRRSLADFEDRRKTREQAWIRVLGDSEQVRVVTK
ncbi:MAG: hypothetical protein ACI8UO_004367 [Verrucomicrobiales bacterium]|jgi:hypothetical protein